MAIQIFDQTPSFGERLGQALGTGLGGLAADYNAKQAANKYKQSLIPYFGKDISNLIANASPEERKFLLQNVDSLLEMDRRRKEGSVNQAIDNQSPFEQALSALKQGKQEINDYIGKSPSAQGLDVFNELMNQKNKMLGLPAQPTTTAQTIDDMIAQAQRQKAVEPLLNQYNKALEVLGGLQSTFGQAQQGQYPQSQSPQNAPMQKLFPKPQELQMAQSERQFQQTQKAKEQRAIEAENKDYLKPLREQYQVTQKMVAPLDEIEKILAKGKVGSSLVGLIPNQTLRNFFSSSDENSLRREIARLLPYASKLVSQGRGSDYLRKLVEQGKLDLSQPLNVLVQGMREIRKEIQDVALETDISNALIAQNNGNQPKNLFSLVTNIINKLPDPASAPKDKVAKVGNLYFDVDRFGNWVLLDIEG